jgi:hypothetical protein
VLRRGSNLVAEFKAEPGRFLVVCPPSTPIQVEPADLLIAQREIDRFEKTFGPLSGEQTTSLVGIDALRHTADFSEVVLRGRAFRFRGIQAAVVQRLHEHAEDGRPWVPGKQLLREAGSHSIRLVDVFKRHPDWRELVESDGCGAYRLKLDSPGGH